MNDVFEKLTAFTAIVIALTLGYMVMLMLQLTYAVSVYSAAIGAPLA